jgi:hypothetical protein
VHARSVAQWSLVGKQKVQAWVAEGNKMMAGGVSGRLVAGEVPER